MSNRNVSIKRRVLRLRETSTKVGLGRATIYRREKDGTFPRRVKLGPGAVGWLEDELDAWLADRVAERDAR